MKGDLAESGLSSVFTPQSTSLAKNESLAHLWSHQLCSPVSETNNQDTKKRISGNLAGNVLPSQTYGIFRSEAWPRTCLVGNTWWKWWKHLKAGKVKNNSKSLKSLLIWAEALTERLFPFCTQVQCMLKPPLSVCVWTKTKLPREDTIACLHLLSLCLWCRWSLTSSNYVDVLRCLQLLQSIQMRNQQEFISTAQDCCSWRGIMQEETERNCSPFFVCVQEEQSWTMPVCAVTTSSNLESFVALFLWHYAPSVTLKIVFSFAWVVLWLNNSVSFFVAHTSD